MKTYNITCPVCGTVNHDLYLDETNGLMECEHCGLVIDLKEQAEIKRIQVYTGNQVARFCSEILAQAQ